MNGRGTAPAGRNLAERVPCENVSMVLLPPPLHGLQERADRPARPRGDRRLLPLEGAGCLIEAVRRDVNADLAVVVGVPRQGGLVGAVPLHRSGGDAVNVQGEILEARHVHPDTVVGRGQGVDEGVPPERLPVNQLFSHVISSRAWRMPPPRCSGRPFLLPVPVLLFLRRRPGGGTLAELLIERKVRLGELAGFVALLKIGRDDTGGCPVR